MASGDPNENNGNDGRVPKDVKGLLRICAEASSTGNNGETVNFTAMEPEVLPYMY